MIAHWRSRSDGLAAIASAGVATLLLCTAVLAHPPCLADPYPERFQVRAADIDAASGVKNPDVVIGMPHAEGDRLIAARVRTARDKIEVRTARALVAMKRARVMDRTAQVADLDNAEARLASARAAARSDRSSALTFTYELASPRSQVSVYPDAQELDVAAAAVLTVPGSGPITQP